MDSKQPCTLIIDSADRVSGGGSADSFTINLRPSLSGVKSVRMLWASIPNPVGNVKPYWLIRVPQFGLPVRPSADGDSATFIVSVDSAQGFRTVHREKSDYPEVALQQPSCDISQLNVSIFTRGGTPAGLTNDWFIVLGLTYA